MPDIKVQIVVENGDAKLRLIDTENAFRGMTSSLNETAAKGLESVNGLTDGVTKLSEAVQKFKEIGEVFIGFEALKSITGGLIETQIAAQQIQFALQAATGSAKGAADEYNFIADAAHKLGINLQVAAKEYSTFLVAANAARVPLKDSRDLFLAVSEAATVLHLSAERVQSTFYALEQMMAMGTVRTRELRIQLGRALPGVYENFMFMVQEQGKDFTKLLRAGELDMATYATTLAAATRKVFSAQDLEDAEKGLNATIGRMQTSMFELKKAMSSGMFEDFVKTSIRDLTKFADFMRGWVGEEGMGVVTTFGIVSVVLLSAGKAAQFLGSAIANTAKAIDAEYGITMASIQAKRQLIEINAASAAAKVAEMNASLANKAIEERTLSERIITANNEKAAAGKALSAALTALREAEERLARQRAIVTESVGTYAPGGDPNPAASSKLLGVYAREQAAAKKEVAAATKLSEMAQLEYNAAVAAEKVVDQEVKVEKLQLVTLTAAQDAENKKLAGSTAALSGATTLFGVSANAAAGGAKFLFNLIGGWYGVVMMAAMAIGYLITKQDEWKAALEEFAKTREKIYTQQGEELGTSLDTTEKKTETYLARLKQLGEEIANLKKNQPLVLEYRSGGGSTVGGEEHWIPNPELTKREAEYASLRQEIVKNIKAIDDNSERYKKQTDALRPLQLATSAYNTNLREVEETTKLLQSLSGAKKKPEEMSLEDARKEIDELKDNARKKMEEATRVETAKYEDRAWDHNDPLGVEALKARDHALGKIQDDYKRAIGMADGFFESQKTTITAHNKTLDALDAKAATNFAKRTPERIKALSDFVNQWNKKIDEMRAAGQEEDKATADYLKRLIENDATRAKAMDDINKTKQETDARGKTHTLYELGGDEVGADPNLPKVKAGMKARADQAKIIEETFASANKEIAKLYNFESHKEITVTETKIQNVIQKWSTAETADRATAVTLKERAEAANEIKNLLKTEELTVVTKMKTEGFNSEDIDMIKVAFGNRYDQLVGGVNTVMAEVNGRVLSAQGVKFGEFMAKFSEAETKQAKSPLTFKEQLANIEEFNRMIAAINKIRLETPELRLPQITRDSDEYRNYFGIMLKGFRDIETASKSSMKEINQFIVQAQRNMETELANAITTSLDFSQQDALMTKQIEIYKKQLKATGFTEGTTAFNKHLQEMVDHTNKVGLAFSDMGNKFAATIEKMLAELASSQILTALKMLADALAGVLGFKPTDTPYTQGWDQYSGPGFDQSYVPSGKSKGGLIKGPGSSTSDSIPVNVSDGEYVVKAASVKKYGPKLLDAINTMQVSEKTIKNAILNTTTVKEEKPRPKFTSGGAIKGPGSSTSDSIPIMASDGEYIIRAAAVKKYGLAMFDSLNAMQAPPKTRAFATGGLISSSSNVTNNFGGGAAVDVQVINNSGQPATTEKGKGPDGRELIKVIIGQVASDIRNNGPVSQSISSTFGTSRLGVNRG